MNSDSRVFVAGHNGLVGSAIVRRLQAAGFNRLIVCNRKELDLTRQSAVDEFFAREKPQFVIVAAAKVGGIHANNSYPADFIRENLQIEVNVIDAAYRHGVTKLLLLGSSCIYPRLAAQPMKEESLLTGPLEPTNEWYAIAKIAGIKMCQAYRRQYGFRAISAMPTNLYGPGDNFNLETSHVLPALIRRFHDAKVSGQAEVVVWGTGTPQREFLYVDDLADAVVHLMDLFEDDFPINIGVGTDLTIRQLAELIAGIVGYQGKLTFDASKPDGTPKKLLDVSRLAALGWRAKSPLDAGIKATYEWFLGHQGQFRS
jgi:GDP-L-fucose synthase